MRRVSFSVLISIALIAPLTQADTLHLKNGSVLKGKVTSFADDQFVVLLDTGSGRYISKAMVYMGDVARIEFDAAAGAAPESASSQPAETPRQAVVDPPRTSSPEPVRTEPVEQPKVEPKTEPKTEPKREPETQTSQPPQREPEPTLPDRPSVSTTPPPTTTDIPETEKPKKLTGPVRTVTVDVAGKRDWTSTGLIVKRGDRIRVTATGLVTLDPVSGRSTGPEGSPDTPDSKKLMADQPTGALIGVVGADNDDFIFIGKFAEFTATRDGLLFVSVNEGNLADNTGSYKAVIELQAARR